MENDGDTYGWRFDFDIDQEEDAIPCECSLRGRRPRPVLRDLRLPAVALHAPPRSKGRFIGKGRSQLLRERALRNRTVGRGPQTPSRTSDEQDSSGPGSRSGLDSCSGSGSHSGFNRYGRGDSRSGSCSPYERQSSSHSRHVNDASSAYEHRSGSQSRGVNDSSIPYIHRTSSHSRHVNDASSAYEHRSGSQSRGVNDSSIPYIHRTSSHSRRANDASSAYEHRSGSQSRHVNDSSMPYIHRSSSHSQHANDASSAYEHRSGSQSGHVNDSSKPNVHQSSSQLQHVKNHALTDVTTGLDPLERVPPGFDPSNTVYSGSVPAGKVHPGYGESKRIGSPTFNSPSRNVPLRPNQNGPSDCYSNRTPQLSQISADELLQVTSTFTSKPRSQMPSEPRYADPDLDSAEPVKMDSMLDLYVSESGTSSSSEEYVIPERYRSNEAYDPLYFNTVRRTTNLGDFIKIEDFPSGSKKKREKKKFAFPEHDAKMARDKAKNDRASLFEDPWLDRPSQLPALDSTADFPGLSGSAYPALGGGLGSAGMSRSSSSVSAVSMTQVAGLLERSHAQPGPVQSSPPSKASPINPKCVVYIDNLPESCEQDSLEALLSQYGDVCFCRLEQTAHGTLRAEVELATEEACEWAVDCLNGEDATLAAEGQRINCYRK